MSSLRNKVDFQMKPPPPPYLSKETLIIWESWGKMGDREVAREAAVKGSHIDLVKTFLSLRKGVNLMDVEAWINNEIRCWAFELLSNKQVFRASHILTNIKLDPVSEIQRIFGDTSNKELRDYLGNHLGKVGSLDGNLKQSWDLLNLIEGCGDSDLCLKLNIKAISSKDREWKSRISSKLFLNTLNFDLTPFIEPLHLWQTALTSNNCDFLTLWINTQYSTEFPQTNANTDLIEYLLKSEIDSSMLNALFETDSNLETISPETKTTICDSLAKYGIFDPKEENDLCRILSVLGSIGEIHNLEKILSSSFGNLSKEKMQSLIFDYCLRKELYVVMDVCTKNYSLINEDNPNVTLMISNRDFIKNINDKERIVNNLSYLIEYLGESADREIKLIVELFLRLLKKDDLFTAVCALEKNSSLEKARVLNKIFKKAIRSEDQLKITFYDLLQKHLDVNAQKLFACKFDPQAEIPHFNSKPLVEQHGFKKELSFTFYLLENRPSKAHQALFSGIDGKDEILRKVRELGLNNFTKKNVGASCIAFLEMIGENSDTLRVDLKIADLLWNSGMFKKIADVSELMLCKNLPKNGGLILRDYSEKAGDAMLQKDFREEITVRPQIDNSLISILETVESTIYSQLDLIRNKSDTIEALKIFEIFYKYAENNKLKLPDVLLETLAKNEQWLLFLITIQKHNYPQEQLIKLVQNFKRPQLLEHVSHCILHDFNYEHKNAVMRERDSRNYFLSRLGVRKQLDDSMTTSATSQSSYGSTSSSGLSDYSDVEILDLNNQDLLQVLIKCHNSGDPPKALLHACVHYKYPLFAVLATCYESDSVVINWLTWLGVTCNLSQTRSYESMALIGSDVIGFMRTILEHGYYKTLKQSFEIFLPENPLNVFITMLSDCISGNFETESLHKKIQNFHNLLKSCAGNNLITEVDPELTYLNNKVWIESAAVVLLASALQHCFKTVYNKIQFLKSINEIGLQSYFSTALPDFESVQKILVYLFKAQISVPVDFFKLCKIESHKEEIIACIDRLVKLNMFEEALKVADISECAADAILSKKWKLIFSERGIGEVLHECDAEFKKLKMIPKNAVLFYTQFPMDDPHNKYKLLGLAYQWASQHELEEEPSLEFEMWAAYLKLNDSYQNEIKYKNTNLKLFSEMKLELERLPTNGNRVNLDNHEVNRLDLLIDQLLNSGDVFQAFKLEKMFGHNNSNLEILRLCFNLAEGLKLPFQLSAEERLLLRKRTNFRSFSHRVKSLRPARLSSLSSVSRSPGTLSVSTVLEVEAIVEDILTLIENLIDGLTSGLEIGQNIFMLYRISLNVDKKYSSIVKTTDPEAILLEALENDCRNKLEVVHDYITVYKWPKQKIAHFLCEQIIFMIINTTERKENCSELWDVNLDTDIHLILQLLPDSCSILGKSLYTYASALHKSQSVSADSPNMNEIIHVVELLIRAHDCYTADCNMEGISVILKKCQTLINLLLTLKNWYLIVRLLTGVARYNELNYVFHILRENDQFEYLLRRGKNTRDNGLKVTLLEYLKRYCPDNRELYKMVALHFSLYSEVAQLWENESASIIRNLIAISKLEMQNRKVNPDTCAFVELTNTDGTRLCLNKAMENYTHASEYHLEGDKLAKAMNAARRAELVALQMSLLKGLPNSGTANCILNLNNSQINTLILQELSFPQALILTEAYEHPIDWSNVLFEQYIMNNKSNYLANYLSVFSLNDSLVYDISRRFLNGNINVDSAIHNMKSLLRMLPSVHVKYRVASELGFLDIVEDLLNTNKLMYLKDTVWKKGYKN